MDNQDLIYRCRLCGKENYITQDKNALEELKLHRGGVMPIICHCDDGRFGLADLIAARSSGEEIE